MRMGGKAEAVNAGVSDDSRAKAGTAVRVVELPGERLAEAASVLARAFHNNPNFVDLFPDPRARSRALPALQGTCLRDALGFGRVYAAVRGASGGGELVGVAAWLPPGGFPLSPMRQLRALPGMARILAAAPRSFPRLARFGANVTRLHPALPYWYLEVVGVDPGARGLGVGTRLLEPGLTRADEAGHHCYLETMTERNVAWYRGLGFEVDRAGVFFTPGGPPKWTMIRTPRQPRP
jgi:ribosomal protein S18 acetylase RimI-like enzyme